MQPFKALSEEFGKRFNHRLFPVSPANLYDPAEYILGLGGKHIRPVLCLMGNELFDELNDDAYSLAIAAELFHNFTLVHDDIMDKAPLRRGMPAVHHKYGQDSALLAGDVMLVYAYMQLSQMDERYLKRIMEVFNCTAAKVCEGQQLDMDYAALPLEQVDMEAYMHMITLKTSVLLAASLKMGGILGGASEGNLEHLYAFGRYLGIAFQIHDDYLDAFGNPDKFGKQPGGDILVNKKTFLLLKAWELADQQQRAVIRRLMESDNPDRVDRMLRIYQECKVDQWAREEKKRFMMKAIDELEKVTVLSSRKKELGNLIDIFLDRDH